MANYTKINVGNEGRVELHDKLALTGAEVSVNRLSAGAGVPFVHSHKNNEEIYGILEGRGKAVIDGEEIALAAGDWLRVAPGSSPRRPMRASPTSASRSEKTPSADLRRTTRWFIKKGG